MKLKNKLLLVLTLSALFLVAIYFSHFIKKESIPKDLEGILVYSDGQNIISYNLELHLQNLLYSTKETSDGVFCVDLSPSRKEIVSCFNNPIEGERLSLIDINGKRTQILLDGEGKESFRGVAWSPDKLKIAIAKGTWINDIPMYKLYLVNSDGTGLKKISNVNMYFNKPSWSPDGKQIAFTGFENVDWERDNEKITREGISAMGLNIYIVDVETGATKKILNSGVGPSWSPDGSHIAFYKPVPFSNKFSLMLLDIKNQDISELIKNKIFTESPAWSPDGKFLLYTCYKKIFLPPERQVFEVYSLKNRKSYKLFETGAVNGFAWR